MENQEPTTSATTNTTTAAATIVTNNSTSSSNSIDTTNDEQRQDASNSGGGANGRLSASEDPVVVPLQVNTLCRICMCDSRQDEGSIHESIYRTTVESKSLYSMLLAVCAPLTQTSNEGMPDKICNGCKVKLVQAYKLYETCIKSDERIRKIIHRQLAGGMQIKQEIDDDDVQLANQQLYYDSQGNNEDGYEMGYPFEGHFYSAALCTTTHSTPNLKIHSVRNGPEVLVQLQEHHGILNDFSPAIFECEKFVKVTPKGHHCLLCGKDFKYFSYFKQHALAQHDPSKPFKCQQCKYTFKTEQRLYIHMRNHLEAEDTSLGPEALELLEQEFEQDPDHDPSDDTINEDDSQDLEVSINPDTGEKVFTCLICQKQLTTLPLYRRHQSVHTVRGRPYKCDICHYRFAAKFSFNAHMQRHEEGKDPAQPATYKCNDCDEIFLKRKLLNLHVATQHDKSPVSLNKTAPAAILTSSLGEGRHGHVCPICSETFNRESVLNNHMKMHELEAAQLKHSEVCYVCTVCGMECETREIFNSHILTHGDVQFPKDNASFGETDISDDEQPQNGEDPLSLSVKSDTKAGLKCELCSKTFPYACNLKQHKIIHHSDLKPHECNVCHYRFEYEGTLLRHMQKHSKLESLSPSIAGSSHNEDAIVAPPGAALIYKCKLCSARFQKQKSMTWHLQTHRSIVGQEGSNTLEQSLNLPSPGHSSKSTHRPSSTSSPPSSPTPSRSPPPPQSSFGAKLELKSPQVNKSADGSKMYKCGYCPQNLESEEAYVQHLKGHRMRSNPTDPLEPDSDTPPPKKKRAWVRSGEHHRCPLCKKVFTFRSQLQQHTVLHHQPGKPYECAKCHYSFVHKLNLKRHELTHLEEERLASEDDPSIQLLEDEGFNADLDELVEPVIEESAEGVVVNSDGSDQPQSGDGAVPKKKKCVVCSAIFQREDLLIEHLKTHIDRIKMSKQETQSAKKILTDENDRKCKLCSKVFKFSCQLKQHVQMHHSKDKPFECNICRYRFEFKGHMIRHKAINHAEEVAAEEADSDELPTKITTPVVNADGSEVYQCPVCPLNFAKQRSLTWHLKTHNNSKKAGMLDGSYASTSSGEVVQCRVCSHTFRDVYELKAHMATHMGGGGSAVPVIEAEHSLFGSGLDMMLQDFPDTMENHGDPLFDESNLELVLEDGFDNDLDFNMRYHDTPTLPPAKRSLPASESSVYDVAEPGASTAPSKGKIVCELCKKDFLYSCNLKQHMQLHHAKEKPFECKICFYRFEYSGHLVRHIRQNHDTSQIGDITGEAVERNFVCTFCSELFEQKGQLNAHIQAYHKGEKQFKCEFCPASFAYKKTYDTHREEHISGKRSESATSTASASTSNAATSGTTPTSFSCNFCKKTFSSAQKVDNHVCFQ